MINISKLKNKAISFVLCSTMFTTVSCSSNSLRSNLRDQGISLKTVYESPENLYKMNAFNSDVISNLDLSNITIYNSPICDYEKICTPEKFSKYTCDYNVTYSDIKDIIEKKDLNLSIKKLLLKGIDNLDKNNFNMNLAVLKYNLSNLTVRVDDEYLESTPGALAVYEPISDTVIISSEAFESDNFEDIFYHEVFGHGMTCAYYEKDKVLCSTSFCACIIEDDTYKGNFVFGKAFEEALAELIKYYCTDRKIDNEYSFYSVSTYILLMILKSNNITIEEYANEGVNKIVVKLIENNLSNQVGIVKKVDEKLFSMTYYNEDTDNTVENIIVDYIYELINRYKNTELTDEEIDTNIDNIIECYKEYIKPTVMNNSTIFSMGNDNVFDYITIENIKAYVEDCIVKNKKYVL